MAKTPNHLHRYKKVNLGQNGKEYLVYRCMKPACNHYLPVHLTEGKLCECNRCGSPMVISKFTLQGSSSRALTRPHCVDCTKSKESKKVEELAALAEYLDKGGL